MWVKSTPRDARWNNALLCEKKEEYNNIKDGLALFLPPPHCLAFMHSHTQTHREGERHEVLDGPVAFFCRGYYILSVRSCYEGRYCVPLRLTLSKKVFAANRLIRFRRPRHTSDQKNAFVRIFNDIDTLLSLLSRQSNLEDFVVSRSYVDFCSSVKFNFYSFDIKCFWISWF